MPTAYKLLAAAGISAFLSLVAFYLPWIRYQPGAEFYNIIRYEGAPPQNPPPDAQTGLDMAADSGRIIYGPLDYVEDDDTDYIHFDGTTYFLDLPIAGGLGTALAAILLLRRRSLPGAYTASFYLISGMMGLAFLTSNMVNLFQGEIIPDVLIKDVYDIHLLYGFWMAVVCFALMFLCGTGLMILARQKARENTRRSRRKSAA
jgi:hypothetical protein